MKVLPCLYTFDYRTDKMVVPNATAIVATDATLPEISFDWKNTASVSKLKIIVNPMKEVMYPITPSLPL